MAPTSQAEEVPDDHSTAESGDEGSGAKRGIHGEVKKPATHVLPPAPAQSKPKSGPLRNNYGTIRRIRLL